MRLKFLKNVFGKGRTNGLLRDLTEQDKAVAVKRLISDSAPRGDFFLMIIFSVFMATFGLLASNAAVIIGSMLIAPMLSPVLSLSMGVAMADGKLVMRALWTIAKAVVVAAASSALITLLFAPTVGLGADLNQEIISRTQPDITYAAVAVIAGLAAAFALIRPQLSATLPGVAISVALIPPLGVTGMGIARLDWSMTANSLVLFLVNAASIALAGLVVFSMARFYTKQPTAEREIVKEQTELNQK